MYTDLSTDKANNVYSAYYIPKIHPQSDTLTSGGVLLHSIAHPHCRMAITSLLNPKMFFLETHN